MNNLYIFQIRKSELFKDMQLEVCVYIYAVKFPKWAIAVQSGPLQKYNISSRREAEITLLKFIYTNCICMDLTK